MTHAHNVYDTDTHYIIDGVSRAVTNLHEVKNTIMQYDHNSERLTFELPRVIDGHDLTLCNAVRVHFINICTENRESHNGLYVVDDLRVKEDDEDTVIFSWLISSEATQFVGPVDFNIRFLCLNGDKVDYAWNTAVCSNIVVSDGINSDETFEHDYSDIIAKWQAEVSAEIAEVVVEEVHSRINSLVAPYSIDTNLATLELDDGDPKFPFRATIISNGVNCKLGIDLSEVEVGIGDEKVSNVHPLPLNFAPLGNVCFENEAYAFTLVAFETDVDEGVMDVRFELKNKTNGILAVQGVAMYYPAIYPSLLEVQEIRMGANGVRYDTAALAVNGQFDNANEMMNDFNDDLGHALREIEELKNNGTGGGSVTSVNGQTGDVVIDVPIKYIESPDADGNIVCLRDLESGTYSLMGTFMPCFDTEDIVELSEHHFFANIMRGKRADTGVNESHIQIYNPNGNVLRYYICTNFAYTSQTIYFNDLTSRQAVEDMIAAAGGGIIVDDELDGNSTNPVQNKVVYNAASVLSARVTDAENKAIAAQNTANDALTAANAAGQTAAMVRDRVDVEVVPSLDTVETAIANQRTVNARDYGAIGDGVTDDTEAIQAALHYAEDNELPLYIPAGNYLVSKTISTYTRDAEGEHPSAALNIYGSGMSTTFTTTEDFEGDYVFNIDAARIQPRMLWVHDFAIDLNADVSGIYFNEIGMKSVVENLWITFNYLKQEADTTVRAGIYCHQATVTTFQRIKVNGNILGLDGKRPMNCGIVVNFMHSTKIIDCDVIFCGWGIYLSGGSNNLIENCRIDENEYGVYQNSSTDVAVDTRAYAVGEIPDSFKGTFGNLTIRKNRFEGNNQASIYLIAFGVGELNYMYNAQITIADNNFTGLGVGTAMWHDEREVFRRAMCFGRCKGIAIVGNKFKGMPYDGTVSQSDRQNISLATRIEDLTLRDNVAITWPRWTDDTTYTVVKTNTKVSSDIVSQLNFINDIEANQTTRQDISVRRNKPDVIRTSGTASASRSNVIYVESGVTVNAVSVESGADLTLNQEVTFIARGDATIKCTNELVLNGGVDFAMGLYDTLTVVCLYHNNSRRWVEKSRSVNRAT